MRCPATLRSEAKPSTQTLQTKLELQKEPKLVFKLPESEIKDSIPV